MRRVTVESQQQQNDADISHQGRRGGLADGQRLDAQFEAESFHQERATREDSEQQGAVLVLPPNSA